MSWLRRIALGLLLALPLLLAAALWFVPRMTDWNEHRDRLAILAAGRLGQPVMLTGPVKLTLLPQPMLEAGGVTIGGAQGSAPDGGISIQAEALRLRLDLGALLRLQLEPREVVLVGAEIRLPWPPTSGQSFRPPPWLTELRGRIEDSRIAIGSVMLDDVTAELAAGSATDALNIDGRFRWRGLDTSFRTTIGRPGWDDAAPLNLTVSAASASLSASGVLLPEGGFEGSIQGGGSDLAALLPGPGGSFRLRGKLSATADLLTASELTMDLGGSPVRGAATLRLAPVPRLDVALVTGRVVLDPWVAALRNASAPRLPFGIDLSAEAATLHGITLRRLRAAAFVEGERLTLSDISAILPGDTEVEMSGVTTVGLPAAGGAGRKLEMAIRFHGTALRATLLALGLRLDATDPTLLRQGEGRMRLVLEESQAAMPEFVATIDGARVSGAGVLRFGARPALGLGLNFDHLDLDGWLPEQVNLLSLATGNPGWDANLRLAAEQAQWRGVSMERLSVDAALEGGRLTARRVAARIAGADLALSGTMAPGASGAPARLTDMALEATAPVARPLLAFMPGTWDETAPITNQPLALRVSANGPLNALALRTGLDLGEARLEANGTLDALAPRYAGSLTLRHPGAQRLISEMLGLPLPLWLGEGSFSVISGISIGRGGAQADHFDMVAGEARLGGQLTLALAPAARPRLTGRLQAERLPLPAPKGGEEPLPLWPLSWVDADLTVTAAQLLAPWLPPMQQFTGSLRLNGGVLQLDQAQAMLRGGQWEGAATLDSTAVPPMLDLQSRLGGIGLGGPLAGTPLDISTGQLEGDVSLKATGHSPAAMLSTLEGAARLGVRNGVMTGADLASALRVASQPDAAEKELRHALLNGATGFDRLEAMLRLRAGRAEVEQGSLMLNDQAAAGVAGEIDLAHGGVDLVLTLMPPEGPPFGLRMAGPLRQPRLVPDLADWLRWRAERP
ncbi:AsmA family protein [Roseomonas marmotae]|uniref:AsmA family protein n=1 Tax=Roseomonas marmotae TaxID=2768161 RepID=A0ABS3KFM2_9PROT|nr:AsmA family protein [Roseomonas marmotae]MBO1076274.1 AsmA family protein [Roseomonas marmotae]QTI77845.1 AsmA family protein [Roseomonas marmotae]